MQGGERVLCDFRFGGGDRGDEARLAGRWVADQCDVGDDLQFQAERRLPSRECRAGRNPGAFRFELARAEFPRPPRPPGATTKRRPGSARSMSSVPSTSLTTVPTGTAKHQFGAVGVRCGSRPCRGRRCPTLRCGASVEIPAERSTWLSLISTMSPPLPPLPPSGPASGLNFSRRIDTHPLPPRPAGFEVKGYLINESGHDRIPPAGPSRPGCVVCCCTCSCALFARRASRSSPAVVIWSATRRPPRC